MLMPSTITALRTRRYDSTRYIPGTIHRSRMTLWMAEGGTVFNRHLSAIYPPTWSNLTPPITPYAVTPIGDVNPGYHRPLECRKVCSTSFCSRLG